MKKKETKIVCPLFGAEITPSPFSGEGPNSKKGRVPVVTYQGQPKASKKATAQERIEALRKVGVDVNNLFAMMGADGGEYVGAVKNGKLSILDDNDPIFRHIKKQGTVPNRRLFRRWVMAQMFHMMTYVPYGQREPLGVTAMIHRLGYEYQWKMLLNELRAQMKMRDNYEDFRDRNRWFNTGVVTAMADDYITQLKIRVISLPEKKCKGVPYKVIGDQKIFVEDLEKKTLHSSLAGDEPH